MAMNNNSKKAYIAKTCKAADQSKNYFASIVCHSFFAMFN